MLQNIRDRTQGWIAGTIISLVILSFALWGIHSYIAGSSNGAVVAKVNGTVITKNQLAAAYERMQRQAQANLGNITPAEEIELKRKALQTLINIQVLKQGSLVQNYRISTNQINNFLESMPEFQVNGEFSLARFQQLLASTLYSAGDFLDLIKTTLLIDQPRLGTVLSSFALPEEVLNTAALVNQKRDVAYLTINRNQFLNNDLTVAANEIEAYYKQHENDFKSDEQVSIEYIKLSVNELKGSFQPTEQELKNFYNENINSYIKPESYQLEKILIPLRADAKAPDTESASAKVNALAQKWQKEPLANTVNLGWMTLAALPQNLQKIVMPLKDAGQVSSPVRTDDGFVLLKLINKKEAQTQAYPEVVAKVKANLIQRKAEEKFAELREKLANTSYEYPDSLQNAASALNLTINSSGLFTHDKGNNDAITSNGKVRDAAFSEEVLHSQNNSDLIQIDPEDVIVLRVKSHIPAALLPLSAVEKQINEKLKNKKADALALKLADEIEAQLEHGVLPDKIAGQYHLSWHKLAMAERYSSSIDSAILYMAFRLPRPTNAAHPAYATVKLTDGYAVVSATAVKDGEIKPEDEEYDIFADQLQNSIGLLEYQLYESSLVKHAKIKVENQQQYEVQE